MLAFQITGPQAERWKQFQGRRQSWEGKPSLVGMSLKALRVCVCVCVFGRQGGMKVVFSLVGRMVHLASNGGLQLGMRAQVCNTIVVEFKILSPYYI